MGAAGVAARSAGRVCPSSGCRPSLRVGLSNLGFVLASLGGLGSVAGSGQPLPFLPVAGLDSGPARRLVAGWVGSARRRRVV